MWLLRSRVELGDWRIACDRGATRALAAWPGHPLRSCSCPYCRNWALVARSALPDFVSAAFARMALDPERPDGLYPTDWPSRTLKCRVTFHCIGKLLDGPPPFRVEEGGFLARPYYPVAVDTTCSVVSFGPDELGRPSWAPKYPGPLVQIALCLTVPWVEPPLAPRVGLHETL
jgi:hypothetical protein